MNNQELITFFDDSSAAFASRSDQELRKMYFLFSLINREYFTKIGTKMLITALRLHFPIHNIVKNTIFKQFCGGETLDECLPVIEHLHSFGIDTILDYSFEGENKEENYDNTVKILEKIIKADEKSSAISHSVLKFSSIGSPSLLERIQKESIPESGDMAYFDRIKKRFDRIVALADAHNVKLFIDAEESWIQQVIDKLVQEKMVMHNAKSPVIFNTYQMYRKDMLEKLQADIGHAQSNGYKLGIKLVRGAYLEKENQQAKVLNIPSPLYTSKNETDMAFDKALKLVMQHLENLEICCGTHNRQSILYLLKLMQDHGLRPQDARISFAQLYGMGDDISFNLAKAGYHVSKYMPFGPVTDVVPYLIRRAEENKSVAGQSSRELLMIEAEMSRRKMKKSFLW